MFTLGALQRRVGNHRNKKQHTPQESKPKPKTQRKKFELPKHNNNHESPPKKQKKSHKTPTTFKEILESTRMYNTDDDSGSDADMTQVEDSFSNHLTYEQKCELSNKLKTNYKGGWIPQCRMGSTWGLCS